MRGHSKMAAICRPGIGFSTDTKSADTLLLDFPVSCPCVKPEHWTGRSPNDPIIPRIGQLGAYVQLRITQANPLGTRSGGGKRFAQTVFHTYVPFCQNYGSENSHPPRALSLCVDGLSGLRPLVLMGGWQEPDLGKITPSSSSWLLPWKASYPLFSCLSGLWKVFN